MTIALVFGDKSKDIRARMMQLRDDLQIDIYRSVEDLIAGSKTRNKVYDRIILLSKVFAPPVDAGQALNDLYSYWRSFCSSSEFVLFARKGREDDLALTFTNKMCSPICTAVLVQNATTVILEALVTFEISELSKKYGCSMDLNIEIETDTYAEPEPEPVPEPSVQKSPAKKNGFFGKFFGKKNKGNPQQETAQSDNDNVQENVEEIANVPVENDDNFDSDEQLYNDDQQGYEDVQEVTDEFDDSIDGSDEFSQDDYYSEDENDGQQYDEFQSEEDTSEFEENTGGYQGTENSGMQSMEPVDINTAYDDEFTLSDDDETYNAQEVDDEHFDDGIAEEDEFSQINDTVPSLDDYDDFGSDFSEQSVNMTNQATFNNLEDAKHTNESEDLEDDFNNSEFFDEADSDGSSSSVDNTDLDEFSDVSMLSTPSSDNQKLAPVEEELGIEDESDEDQGVSMTYDSGLNDEVEYESDNDTVKFTNLDTVNQQEGIYTQDNISMEDDFSTDYEEAFEPIEKVEETDSGNSIENVDSKSVEPVDNFSFGELETESIDEEEELLSEESINAFENLEDDDGLSLTEQESDTVNVEESVVEDKKKGFSLGGLFGRNKKSKTPVSDDAQGKGVSAIPERAKPQSVAFDTASGMPKKGFAPRRHSREDFVQEVQQNMDSDALENVTQTNEVETPVQNNAQVNKVESTVQNNMHKVVHTDIEAQHPQVSRVQSNSEATVVDDDDLFGDLNIAELDTAYKEDEAATNVRVERVEVVKEVIKEMPSSGKSKKVLNSLLAGKGHRVFLVTGDRGTGSTTFAYELAQELSKYISVLFYDGDTDNHGLLNYLSFERFCEYDNSKLQGNRLAKSTKAFSNCVMRYEDNLDLLSSNFGVEVSDDDYESVQSVVADMSNDYNVIIADIPFSKLPLCQELISAATTIVVAEKTKRGLMNLACCFDRCKLPVRYKRKISSTGILMLTKGDNKVDIKKLKRYVSDIVEFDEEDANWLNMRTIVRDKMSSKFLQEIID